MGKTNEEKLSSNDFQQLLLPEDGLNEVPKDKTNYILSSSTSSSIKDSSSASLANSSPLSTTSHLSDYSHNSTKQTDPSDKLNNQKNRTRNEQATKASINIKENKLNKGSYLLLFNDLENLKRKHHSSSPSTKSSSINSLNQLIKSSPSVHSSNLNSRQINRSLTFLDDRNSMRNLTADLNADLNSTNNQYFSNDKFSKLSKSRSAQNQNLNAFESNNLFTQSYKSAIFNDIQHKIVIDKRLDNQFNQPNQLDNQSNSSSKLNFKDNFYRKWFNRFKVDNELNFDQKAKKPKLINLKRYSSIDLETGLGSSNEQNRQSDKENEPGLPGPSGLQKKKYTNNKDDKNYIQNDLKKITNPLHPFYLNAINCVDIDTWATNQTTTTNSTARTDSLNTFNSTKSNSSINDDSDNRNAQNSSSNSSNYSDSNYSTLVCGSSFVPKKLTDKLKRSSNQTGEQQNNSNKNNNNGKKSILLPKLHNEYCANTNSSHHHHSKHHSSENSSNCSSTRSNSSNMSSSSIDDKMNSNKTSKDKSTNDLSGSLSSVSTEGTTDPDKFCKICHLSGRDEDPLISPCKCAGTMQFIHCRCLMRWLEISKKKSRKPLSCELCQYQYQWHKKFKVGQWQFPKCSRRDKFLHCAFLIMVIIMICCALSIIIFFKLQEPVYRVDSRRYDLTINEPMTIGLAMVFVFSFCMSLYAQVKARTTLYRLIMNFIYLNQQWFINEYEQNIKEGVPSTPEVV